VGLGVIPAVGYQYKRVSAQLIFLAASGLMMVVGFDVMK
jgi:hypothetical protein